jgi:hypothetical protein
MATRAGEVLKASGLALRTRKPPVSVGVGEERAKIAGYYFARRHGLIHRHYETISVNPDQTARWRLSVDFELPSDPRAHCGKSGEDRRFLFPVLFLRKAQGRTGLSIHGEDGVLIAAPTRVRSNWISAVAMAEAARQVLLPPLRRLILFERLRDVFYDVATSRAYESHVVLNKLFKRLDKTDPRILERWDQAGLKGDLEMLVEHSVVWLPLQGMPGEQRVIHVSYHFDLERRAVAQWKLGHISLPRLPRIRRRRARQFNDPDAVLDTGRVKFGRKSYRFSFSALGERIAQPLAWMPIELDFPTVYTGRCDSYHFELVCPSGLSPRAVKVTTTDDGVEEDLPGRKTLGSRAAHLYLPKARTLGNLTIRATVGVGGGAFPVLWFLAGAITAMVLWALVASEPTLLVGNEKNTGKNEILAGLLLLVPALLGALVYGSEEGPVARFIGGAKILLLVTGLCAMAATSVLIGAAPFDLGSVAIWTACATVATAATVPLATSWLLSSPVVWHQLRKLDTPAKQWRVLWILIVLAALAVGFLMSVGDASILRVGGATALLVLIVPMILVANDRVAVKIKDDRRYISLSASVAALTMLVLGCIELRAAFDRTAGLHEQAEVWALFLLLGIAPFAGRGFRRLGLLFGPNDGEVHVSPRTGQEFLAGERIRELEELR